MEIALVIVVVAFALGFDYTNSFHDAANAIATSVSTRALTPRAALIMAAVMNFVGAFLGTKVAKTVFSVLEPPDGEHALVVVLAALLGAIAWNLITWYFGLPSSSSHALIGGLVGAGIAGSVTVHWDKVVEKVVYPMLLSPVVGGLLALLLDQLPAVASAGDVRRHDDAALPPVQHEQRAAVRAALHHPADVEPPTAAVEGAVLHRIGGQLVQGER